MIARLITSFTRNYPSMNERIVRLSLFHDKRGPLWIDLKIITDALQKEKIDYAIIGGLAVYKYGYERLTNDLDILLSKEVFLISSILFGFSCFIFFAKLFNIFLKLVF